MVIIKNIILQYINPLIDTPFVKQHIEEDIKNFFSNEEIYIIMFVI